ncbi:hypothetical protein [uncultured Ruegeria sp.]|uniref:hypothetical protein n=1 Tax=uncultured Ruegeria sp. TaxID=259304 RepID=UPI002605321B|nr:hypothetical protein [uncultured Ruegeria sp.]
MGQRSLPAPVGRDGSFGQNNRTFVESASGIHVVNEKGERLIDGPGGMWCTQIGYGREEMAEAMAERARSLAYFSPFNNTNSTAARGSHAKLPNARLVI